MDITITRGDNRTILVDVTQGGVPLNLTGYSIWFTAKQQIIDDDTSAKIRKGNVGPLTGVSVIPNPKTGVYQRIRVDLVNGDTQTLADKYYNLLYDVQIKDGSGSIYTVASGVLNVEPDVTEATA